MLEDVELFGILAISIMVISYALESRRRIFVAIFSLGCAMAAVYAWLIGSYPFMIAEGIWSVIAFRRWMRLGNDTI